MATLSQIARMGQLGGGGLIGANGAGPNTGAGGVFLRDGGAFGGTSRADLMGLLGMRNPYGGASQSLSGPDQQAMTQAWATGNFSPNNPLWNSIDPSYAPQTAQGFTPQIAQAVNGAEPNAGVMRGRNYQLMANLGRPERVAYLQANPAYAQSQGITPAMIAAAGQR